MTDSDHIVASEVADDDANVKRVRDYLTKFGYLTSAPSAQGGKETDDAVVTTGTQRFGASATLPVGSLREAVRRFQEFNGLQITGDLDAATAALMERPRCGVPDVPGSSGAVLAARSVPFTLAATKWDHPDLTYSLENVTPDLQQQDVAQAVAQALGMWSAVTHLSFREVPASEAADLRIVFAAGAHGSVAGDTAFDGTNGVLAHAFFPPPNGGDIAGDVHFDEAETWSVTVPVPGGAIDLVTVAAHEFGHSLGLDHSAVPGSLMAPFYAFQRFLADDDRLGVQAHYGPFTWTLAGNTAGFGHAINDGRPFWIGDFTGDGRSDVLFYFPGDDNWWLGSHDGSQLVWRLVGNTAGFGHAINDGRPFWTGRFSRSDRDEILFYFPGDDNWWLARPITP